MILSQHSCQLWGGGGLSRPHGVVSMTTWCPSGHPQVRWSSSWPVTSTTPIYLSTQHLDSMITVVSTVTVTVVMHSAGRKIAPFKSDVLSIVGDNCLTIFLTRRLNRNHVVGDHEGLEVFDLINAPKISPPSIIFVSFKWKFILFTH